LSYILVVVNPSGTVVSSSPAGASSLSYTIPVGSDGKYYVRVTANGSSAGVLSQYVLGIDLFDTVPPRITGDSLPAEGATVTSILDRYTVNFSKDMNAATVNNLANYDLRSAGPDGVFGSADDVVYHLSSPGYTSGLSASFKISDGPLQPDSYQFTVGTGLTDKSGNQLVNPYVRHFTVANVSPFTLESRSNDTFGTATPLGTAGTGFAGSFTAGTPFAAGAGAFSVTAADLNKDGNLDFVTANYNTNTVSAFLNN